MNVRTQIDEDWSRNEEIIKANKWRDRKEQKQLLLFTNPGRFLPGFVVTWNEEEQRDEKSIEAVSGSCTEEAETNIDLQV